MNFSLPTGTVTFLFTDIEGSTQLVQRLGARYEAVLQEHHRLLREACEAHGGQEVDTQGDGFVLVFKRAADAVAAATTAQRALMEHEWPEDVELRVRMALHSGEPAHTAIGYIGLDLHLAARVLAAARGGQVLLTRATHDRVADHLPAGVTVRDLGEHRLRDLSRPHRLYQLVIAGLEFEFPPLATISNRPNNLPTPPTPLIGRENEVAEICSLLRGEPRIVTLLGPGGAGKTRLSVQIAKELLQDFDAGVFCVLLATVNDAERVIPTIARTLRVPEVAGLSVAASLHDWLQEKRLLLVLDNFEQVLDAAPAVATLLAACPLLKVLVTSRAPLRVRGEHEFPVPSLELPPLPEAVRSALARDTPDSDTNTTAPKVLPAEVLSAEELSRYAASRLFIERARAVRPDFVVPDETAPVVAEICARLDGLPLAIELAAARIRLFPPAEMLKQLDNRLALLTGGQRDLPERHQTLRDAIAWSYDLLPPGEKSLFEKLSVFAGGCTFEAAAAVTEITPDVMPDIASGLESLIGHSLLKRDTSTPNGEARFTMLATIRDYAAEQLAASPRETPETLREATHEQHAAFYFELAEAATKALAGAEESAWVARLDAEYENLLAALKWLDSHQPEQSLHLAVTLWPYWLRRGRFATGRRLLERALRGNPEAPAPLRATALYATGRLAWFQADYESSRRWLTEARELYQSLDDRRGLAGALYGLGFAEIARGRHDEARTFLEQSLALKQQTGDPTDLNYILTGLTLLASTPEQRSEVAGLLETSLAHVRRADNQRGVAYQLFNIGTIHFYQGDHEAARAELEESLTLLRKLGERWGTARVLWSLGNVFRVSKELAAAQACYSDALLIHQEMQGQWEICENLDGIAMLRAEEEQPGVAVRLLSASATARQLLHLYAVPATVPEWNRYRDALRDELGDAAFEAAWAKGRRMTLPEAVALAMDREAS